MLDCAGRMTDRVGKNVVRPSGGKVVRPVAAGTLHRNDSFPHLYWQNFLAIDSSQQHSAEALIAEADRLFGDLSIRHVLVDDAQLAERLRPGFLEGGYGEASHVTMQLRRPADRQPPPADLVELSAAQLRPAVEAYVRAGPRDEEAVCELCRLKEELGAGAQRRALSRRAERRRDRRVV